MKNKVMIKLVRSSFYKEQETKEKLIEFIRKAEILSYSRECKKYEKEFSKKQQRKYSVFVSSGSSANLVLIQSLLNLGRLKKGDKVGVSALTWPTNIMPIIQLGLTPILIDCELDTLNVSPGTLQENIGEIDALFLTNVLGFSDKIKDIRKICSENKVIFLEDNCEALGSVVGGTLLGNFGLASTFSFFVGHHLSTIEGGMICTDDDDLYHMLTMVREHGWDRNLIPAKKEKLRAEHSITPFLADYTFYDLAFNVRPNEINGFLGNEQIQYLEEIVSKRFQNFKKFQSVVAQNEELINFKLDHMDVISNFAMPIICRNKELFEKYKKRFEDNEVEIRPIIAGNMSNQPFHKKYIDSNHICKNGDFIHQNGFYFGNDEELTDEEINLLCQLLAR